MMPAAIPPAIAPRVGALLRLLGSDVDGEALGAARALGRTLRDAGVDWHALAEAIERSAEPVVLSREAPRPDRPVRPKRPRKAKPSDIVLDAPACRRVGEALWRAFTSGRLSEWETDFAGSLGDQMEAGHCRLTKKQGDALGRLLHRLGEGSAWA